MATTEPVPTGQTAAAESATGSASLSSAKRRQIDGKTHATHRRSLTRRQHETPMHRAHLVQRRAYRYLLAFRPFFLDFRDLRHRPQRAQTVPTNSWEAKKLAVVAPSSVGHSRAPPPFFLLQHTNVGTSVYVDDQMKISAEMAGEEVACGDGHPFDTTQRPDRNNGFG